MTFNNSQRFVNNHHNNHHNQRNYNTQHFNTTNICIRNNDESSTSVSCNQPINMDRMTKPTSLMLTQNDLTRAANLPSAEARFLDEQCENTPDAGDFNSTQEFKLLIDSFQRQRSPTSVVGSPTHLLSQRQFSQISSNSTPLSTPQVTELIQPFFSSNFITPMFSVGKEAPDSEIKKITHYLAATEMETTNSTISNALPLNSAEYASQVPGVSVKYEPVTSFDSWQGVSEMNFDQTPQFSRSAHMQSGISRIRTSSTPKIRNGSPCSTDDLSDYDAMTVYSDPPKTPTSMMSYAEGAESPSTSSVGSMRKSSSRSLPCRNRIRPYSRRTPAERGTEAYQEKRRRNNEAVKRSREKSKQKQVEVEEELKIQKMENQKLMTENQMLKQQLEDLRSRIGHR